MTKRSKAAGILLWVLRVIIYALAVLGSLLTVTLRWLHDTLGSVSFSTALFQLKTPLVGVDNNIVDIYDVRPYVMQLTKEGYVSKRRILIWPVDTVERI